MKSFLLKVKHFFKRNIYPITVTVCTAIVLAIIAVSAYVAVSGRDGVNGDIPSTPVVSDQSSGEDNTDKDKVEDPKPEPIEFVLPFEGASVSKRYTDDTLLEDRTTKSWHTHRAMDFACKEGQKVVAVHDGKVEKVEHTMMNGTVVHLKINDELTVVYYGLSSNLDINEGDTVKRGQNIGSVTSFLTEKMEGIHLHLELYKQGKLANPTEYFTFSK